MNVGGHGVVTMDALKKIFESMGLTEVESFIASGNLVFSSKGVKGLDAKIAAALENALGHEVATFVRTIDEVVAAAAYEPFPKRDAARFPTYLVGFLSKDLDAAGVERLSLLSTKEDLFHVRGRDFWWLSKHHAEHGPRSRAGSSRRPSASRRRCATSTRSGGWRSGTETGRRLLRMRQGESWAHPPL